MIQKYKFNQTYLYLLSIFRTITQINPINDFGLVARSHQDKAWQDAYHAGESHCKMNENDIIRDYQKYVRESDF